MAKKKFIGPIGNVLDRCEIKKNPPITKRRMGRILKGINTEMQQFNKEYLVKQNISRMASRKIVLTD